MLAPWSAVVRRCAYLGMVAGLWSLAFLPATVPGEARTLPSLPSLPSLPWFGDFECSLFSSSPGGARR